ncbi:hypothetical protein KGP36_06025 [Patescibacteria group bacterium]|nr:hypothetical protein [Patescibacteria group bacterium]
MSNKDRIFTEGVCIKFTPKQKRWLKIQAEGLGIPAVIRSLINAAMKEK